VGNLPITIFVGLSMPVVPESVISVDRGWARGGHRLAAVRTV